MAGPEEKEVVKSVIKYKDVFNFEELYKLIFFWLRDNGWIDPEYSDPDNLVFEKSYLQKDSSSGVKEHLIKWAAEKVPHESPYFKFKIEIEFLTIQLKSVEVMHEGKKLSANSGEVDITVKSIIVMDYKGEWDKNSLLKSFHNLWKKRIYKSMISEHKESLQSETESLLGAIKKYLNLKGFLMEFEQEPFYTSGAYPDS